MANSAPMLSSRPLVVTLLMIRAAGQVDDQLGEQLLRLLAHHPAAVGRIAGGHHQKQNDHLLQYQSHPHTILPFIQRSGTGRADAPIIAWQPVLGNTKRCGWWFLMQRNPSAPFFERSFHRAAAHTAAVLSSSRKVREPLLWRSGLFGQRMMERIRSQSKSSIDFKMQSIYILYIQIVYSCHCGRPWAAAQHPDKEKAHPDSSA